MFSKYLRLRCHYIEQIKRQNSFTHQSQFFANHTFRQLHLFMRSPNDEDLFIWIWRGPPIKLAKCSGLLIDLLDCFASCNENGNDAKARTVSQEICTFAYNNSGFGGRNQKLVLDFVLSVTGHSYAWSSAPADTRSIFSPSTSC